MQNRQIRNKRFSIFAGVFIFIMTTTAIAQTQDSPLLSSRQQAIVPVAAFTANGDIVKLKKAIAEGLDSGLTINEIKEVMVQLYAYAGFPRALNALNAFMAVLDEREARGIRDEPGQEATPVPDDENLYKRGRRVQAMLRGGSAVSGGVMDFAPAIDRYLNEHLFGDIFASDVLDFQAREIATVSALSTMRGAEAQLHSHLRNSMHVGLTEGQLREVGTILQDKVGKNEGTNTLAQLDAIISTE